MGIIKKSFIVGMLFVALCLFPSCGSSSMRPDKKNNNLDLTKDEIQHINISSSPSIYPEVNTTDKDQISMIVDYFTSLHFSETELNPDEYLGMNSQVHISV